MSETEIMRQIQIRASEQGHRLWRNNIGFCKDPILRYGLCPGSSDLIGLTKHGQFLAVEVKTPKGRLSESQDLFLRMIQQLNGIGLVARKVEDFNV